MTGEPETLYWYAVRTRSRHEKRVRDQLEERPGVEVFLPLWERRSRSGYCFARFRYGDRLQVLKAFGVAGLVGMKGQPEPVPDAEIEAVRSLVESTLRYDPYPYLKEGMEVEVVRGPLMGVRGRLVRKERATRLVLSVSLIRQSVAVEIDAADVTPV